jgi:hypothetical protein
MAELNNLDTVNLLKAVGELLQTPTTTSNTNSLTKTRLLQASQTTTHTRTLALTNKATKFLIMVEHLTEHLHRVHLSSTAANMTLSNLVLRRMDSMVRMISNSNRATVKVLHPVMVKDSLLDTTKEVVTEVE